MDLVDGRGLELRADLQLDTGALRAQVVADGRRLTIRTEDSAALWAELAGIDRPAGAISLPRLAGRVAAVLDDVGLSAELVTNRGLVLELGHGCDSIAGRLLTHDRHVRLGTVRVLGPMAVSAVSTSMRTHARTVAVAAAVTIAAVAAAATIRKWSAR